MADGRKRSGPLTDSLWSPSSPKERAIRLGRGIRVRRYYCCVLVLYFKAPPFFGQLLVLQAAPGLMGRAQGRSPSTRSFSGDCSNV